MKNIALLGSTGSIGRQTLEVVEEFPEDFKVQILAARGNWELIMEQAKRFAPHYVVLTDEAAFEQLKSHCRSLLSGCCAAWRTCSRS